MKNKPSLDDLEKELENLRVKLSDAVRRMDECKIWSLKCLIQDNEITPLNKKIRELETSITQRKKLNEKVTQIFKDVGIYQISR